MRECVVELMVKRRMSSEDVCVDKSIGRRVEEIVRLKKVSTRGQEEVAFYARPGNLCDFR